jgi:hypothetical protein
MKANTSPLVYDAVALLGFGSPTKRPIPKGKKGEIVIRYGGWSLRELCASSIVCDSDIMWQQDWYHHYPWSDKERPSGIYRLRIPVPDSNSKTYDQQALGLLSTREMVAPVVLVATAMLVHRIQTLIHLPSSGWIRCSEKVDDRIVVYWREGRLRIGTRCDDTRSEFLWLSSVRTS